MNLFMNYATILSGYLVANHFVGEKLSSLQFWIMTITYSIFILATLSMEFIVLQNLIGIAERIYEGETLEPKLVSSYLLTITMLVVFIGSLLFAYSIRSQVGDDT
jgi:hypothetical protein